MVSGEIKDVLYNIGLNDEEITECVSTNKYLTMLLDVDVIQVIQFLHQYGLADKEIGEIAKKNPWILTENFERMRMLEEDYTSVGIGNIGELLKRQPIAMSLNPKELDDFIQNQTKEGKTKEEIREIIMESLDRNLSL